jgi:hypothetical protein
MKKRKLYLLLFAVFVTTHIFSQFSEDDYRKQADEIRNDVWNSKMPFFDQRVVPDGYEKYSKVILARRQELSCLATSKMKFNWVYGRVKETDLAYTYIFREEAKINDEASLQYYSQISFQKFSKYSNSKSTAFLGFRVIKPDGTIKETDPDEIILTEDKENDKQAKLAVADLQIGDIVDYFIETVSSLTGVNTRINDEYQFAEEDPMLHYSVHLELNNNLSVQYRSMNGAPEFKVTTDTGNNTILDAEQSNIKQYPINLWISKYRQIPLVRVYIYYGSGEKSSVKSLKPDTKNSPADGTLNYWKSVLENYSAFAKKNVNPNREKIKQLAQSYFQNNGGGTIENSSLGYYYAARHFFLLRPDKKDLNAGYITDDYGSDVSLMFFSMLQVLFDENKFDAQIILLPSRFGPRISDAMYADDFGLALLTNDKHIYTVQNVFDSPDQLPYYFEGQPPTSLYKEIDFGNAGPDKSGYNLALSPAESNVHTENLTINFNPDDPQKINVERKTVLTGHAKLVTQKSLVIDEDYYAEERKVMGISQSFIDELNSTHKGEKIVSEYQSVFDDGRKKLKEDVKNEIEQQFDIEQVELSDYNIEQAGIFINKPEFIYNTKFSTNNWINTAGSNYILEVGKMVTPAIKLTPEQRERNLDVYMAYARTFQYNVEILVPNGFSVEGIDKLNTKVENTTGSFVTTASLDSGKVTLHVTQTFNHVFEKTNKWPELLEILDAATSFENAKILLKKS